MKDEEIEDLKRRLIISLIIIVIFLIPFFIFIYNKSGATDSTILKKINKDKRLFILVRENKCNNCKELEELLKNKNVKYIVLNKDNVKNYNYILNKIDISPSDIITPTLLYIEDSKNYASLIEIKDINEADEFIDNYINR